MNSSCQLDQDSHGVCMVKYSLILFKLCEDKELLPSGKMTSSIIPRSEIAKKTDTETFYLPCHR